MDALTRAILIVGGPTALAKKLDVHPNVVTNWRARGVPPLKCIDIEKATNRAVRCEDLDSTIDWAYLRNSQPA